MSPEQIVQQDIWRVNDSLVTIANELSARIDALAARVAELEAGR